MVPHRSERYTRPVASSVSHVTPAGARLLRRFLLAPLVDVEQIGYGLDLDFKLRWGGPLVVDVSFLFDDRQRGFGQDQWETEVTVKLDGHSEIEYIEWLKHMSKNEQGNNMAVPAAEEPEKRVLPMDQPKAVGRKRKRE